MLEYAADLDLIVIDHCEDPYLAAKSHMNEGVTSGVLGVKGQPDVAETIQASRSILLADYLAYPCTSRTFPPSARSTLSPGANRAASR